MTVFWDVAPFSLVRTDARFTDVSEVLAARTS
jgi:hypothetical protein